MATVTILKKELKHYDTNGNLIHEIKEFRNNKLRPCYKSINGIVKYNLRENNHIEQNETNIESNINLVMNKFFKVNKKSKKILKKVTILLIILLTMSYKLKIFSFANTQSDIELINFSSKSISCLASNVNQNNAVATAGYNESIRFVHFVINILRGLIASICGLNIANCAMTIVTQEQCNVQTEAKRAFQKILWALFLAFAGTGITEMIAKKILAGEL